MNYSYKVFLSSIITITFCISMGSAQKHKTLSNNQTSLQNKLKIKEFLSKRPKFQENDESIHELKNALNTVQSPNDYDYINNLDTKSIPEEINTTSKHPTQKYQSSHSGNFSPNLDLIENKQMDEGKLLIFTISASDPGDDPLHFSTSTLPQGAFFDANAKIFTWTPEFDQAGVYGVTFSVSDGELVDSQTISITINNVYNSLSNKISIENINEKLSKNIGEDKVD